MAAETEFLQGVAIVDPKTGLPTKTALQKLNSLRRGLGAVGDQIDGVEDGIADEATDAEVRSAAGDDYVSAQKLASAAAFVTLTDAATVAVDWLTGINFVLILGGDRTLGFPSNGIQGQTRTILVGGVDGTPRSLAVGNFRGGTATLTGLTSAAFQLLTIFCWDPNPGGHFILKATQAYP